MVYSLLLLYRTRLRIAIVDHCGHETLHKLRSAWSEQIEEIASRYGIGINLVWLQICLHAPLYDETQLLQGGRIPGSLLATVTSRLESYLEKYKLFLEKCGADLLQDHLEKVAIDNNRIRSPSGISFSFRIATVDQDSGEFIESNLHYLHSPISSTEHRYGIFLDDFTLPICYVSAAIVDRQYKIDSLSAAISGEVRSDQVLNIARIYGFGHLPKNAISVLLSYVTRQLAKSNIKYVVTAVNPMLGFSGTSMLASGFKPYTLCPVAYGYCRDGFYRTRRHNQILSAQLKTPPNVLFVRGITKDSRKKVEQISSIFIISSQLYQKKLIIMQNNQKTTGIIGDLDNLRAELEKAWDNITRYHRISYEPNDPISKGQCGVTSAYLAQKFQENGYNVLFCEGNVRFPDETPPIINHCWIKIPKFNDNNPEIVELIIDLTADQSGYTESVICDTNHNLLSKGIVYEQLREVEPKAVEAGHLSSRLNSLQKRLENFVQSDR
jgi:hypothetical protein